MIGVAAHVATVGSAGIEISHALGQRTAINHRLKPHLVRSTFHSCRADTIEDHSG
jgi:hypothetical protein